MNETLSRTDVPAKPRVVTRYLRLGDIPALIDLEKRQWTDEQAAGAHDFRQRIRTHPRLCGGAFCAETGVLLASLFCKPTTPAEWVEPGSWARSAALDADGARARPHDTECLFGISLTSIEPGAARQLIAFQFLDAIRHGRRYIYLGSPMPGLARHLARCPNASVDDYARATRAGLPIDPQLRYYHGKGFREIVAVRANYFPHEASCDYGAILRAKVPHTWLGPLLRLLPDALLRRIAALAPHRVMPRETTST
jgi:hypothetical protein